MKDTASHSPSTRSGHDVYVRPPRWRPLSDTTSHCTTLRDTRTEEVKASVGPRVAAHLPFAKSGSTDHTAAVEETRKAYIQASSSRNARYALVSPYRFVTEGRFSTRPIIARLSLLRTGFTSTIGVPLIASRLLTLIRLPPIVSTSTR